MSVQVQFLDSPLKIVSIPIDKYPYFLHAILELILRPWKSEDEDDSTESDNRRDVDLGNDNEFDERFLTVTLTPTECSVICSTDLFAKVFTGPLNDATVVSKEYAAVKIDSDGADDSTRRILDLSAPLSSAGIPIFFVSTYFSDYMLVPTADRFRVEQLLQDRNFVFSSLEHSYIALKENSPTPSDVTDCAPLKQYGLKAQILSQSKLVLTGARPHCDIELIELALVKSLIVKQRFFSFTAHRNELSFLLDHDTLKLFPRLCLLGSLEDYFTPVFFDLSSVPVDVVGIVADVSRSLRNEDIAMNYVSTALSSTVLVTNDVISKVSRVLGI